MAVLPREKRLLTHSSFNKQELSTCCMAGAPSSIWLLPFLKAASGTGLNSCSPGEHLLAGKEEGARPFGIQQEMRQTNISALMEGTFSLGDSHEVNKEDVCLVAANGEEEKEDGEGRIGSVYETLGVGRVGHGGPPLERA